MTETTSPLPQVEYYRATVQRTVPEAFVQETSGSPATVAAFLRAIAEQIDPRPPAKPSPHGGASHQITVPPPGMHSSLETTYRYPGEKP